MKGVQSRWELCGEQLNLEIKAENTLKRKTVLL